MPLTVNLSTAVAFRDGPRSSPHGMNASGDSRRGAANRDQRRRCEKFENPTLLAE